MTLKTALAMAALVTTSLVAAQGTGHQSHKHGSSKSQARQAGHGGMMAGMDMAKCMRDMEAGQKKLQALATKMNAARGAARTDAISAVINEMVKQQREMMQMCHMMMSHHMSGGEHQNRAAKAAPKPGSTAHNHNQPE